MSRKVPPPKVEIASPEEGKLVCSEIMEQLLTETMPAKEIYDDRAAVKFISECYFITVTNLVNMAFLPMDMESQLNEMEAFMGSFRQLKPIPKPKLEE